MSELVNCTISEFGDLLASPSPAPGGGGASALVGMLGCALGEMSGNLTLGKKKYADVEEDIKELMDKAAYLRGELRKCIDDDAAAFEPLSKAYGLPKDYPGREDIMEEALRKAAEVPYKIMTFACEMITLNDEFADKASKLVISDAATGASLCKAALIGGLINVRVNTKLMKDRAYADFLEEKAMELARTYSEIADRTCTKVLNQF